MNPLSGHIPQRAVAFAELVREFQQAVNAAGGGSQWERWKDKTLEEAFEVLCTNSITVKYVGPDHSYPRLNADEMFPYQ